jgi:hypothetical protein
VNKFTGASLYTLTSGCQTIVDLTVTLSKGGVFGLLSDPKQFKRVRLENEGRAIVWPGGVDIGADALYGPSVPTFRPKTEALSLAVSPESKRHFSVSEI